MLCLDLELDLKNAELSSQFENLTEVAIALERLSQNLAKEQKRTIK